MPILPAVVLLIVIGSSKNILQAVTIQKDKLSPTFVSTALFATPLFFLSLPSLLFFGFDWQVATRGLPYLLISIPCFVLGVTLSYKSLQYLDVGIHVIIDFLITGLTTILVAWFFLNETLYGWQWLGVACLCAGITVIHAVGRRADSRLLYGLTYASLGGVLVGIGLTVDKIILDTVGLSTFFVIAPGTIALTAIGCYIARQKYQRLPILPRPLVLDHWLALLGLCGLYVVSLCLYITTLRKVDNVAYLNAITGFTLVLTPVLGILILKETNNLRSKLIGVFMAVLGLVLLA